ncbi:MAG: hypothetical protein C0507_08295 [Cyanobacteria bacterium PR.3.49]|nr:hypothetical protein [Cyanobacteria bacterium PR.3.49]
MASDSSEELKEHEASAKFGKRAAAAQICAWTIALCLTADIGASIAFKKPRAELKLPVYGAFMRSQDKPDVLVLGSSVALCSSFCADQTIKKLSKEEKSEYTGALYLQKQVKEKSGQEVTTGTLATAGAMASDAWMLVKKLVEFDKKPKIIIYETVSRDLFDASMPQIGDTPVYRALASIHPPQKNQFLPKPVIDAIDNVQRSPFVTALTISFSDTRFLTDPERLQFCVDAIASSLSFTYKTRTENRTWLTDKLCTLLNRKASIYEAAQAAKSANKNNGEPTNGLVEYQVDSRPQEKRYADELVYFEKLIKLCRDNSIELVVVLLPVNKGQYGPKLPPSLRKAYPGDSLAITKRYNVQTFDYDSDESFNASHFTDHVHLNELGAVKLTDQLTSELAKGSMLSNLKKAEHTY